MNLSPSLLPRGVQHFELYSLYTIQTVINSFIRSSYSLYSVVENVKTLRNSELTFCDVAHSCTRADVTSTTSHVYRHA